MFLFSGKSKRKFLQNINGIKDIKATDTAKKVVLVNKQFYDSFINWLSSITTKSPENLNTKIFFDEKGIKPDLKRGLDYEIISLYLWKDIIQQFGSQPKIEAVLIKNPKSGEETILFLQQEDCLEFDIYLPKKVTSNDTYSISLKPIQHYSHPNWLLEDVKKQICKNYNLNTSQFSFTKHESNNKSITNGFYRTNDKFNMRQVYSIYNNELDLRQNKLIQANNRDRMSLRLHRNPSDQYNSQLKNKNGFILNTNQNNSLNNSLNNSNQSNSLNNSNQSNSLNNSNQSNLLYNSLNNSLNNSNQNNSLNNSNQNNSLYNSLNNSNQSNSLNNLPKPVGLYNLGNTCFFNAAVQCLVRVMPLTLFILSDQFYTQLNRSNPNSSHGQIATAYRRFLEGLCQGSSSSPRDPSELRNAIISNFTRFANFRQHDSQEFLCSLLDGLHEDINQSSKVGGRSKPIQISNESDGWDLHISRHDSPIVDIFHGILYTSIVCPSCGWIEKVREPFEFLSLDVPRKFGSVKLESCLSKFSKKESLDWRNKWLCEKCKKKVCPTKETGVEKCGKNALIIHLKRFSGEGLFSSKIDTNVEYPDVLVVDSFSKVDRGKFKLVGAVFHFGGLGGGHYKAAAIDPCSNEWYIFNDSTSRRIDRSEAHNKNAYILFYQRYE